MAKGRAGLEKHFQKYRRIISGQCSLENVGSANTR
jgi:hypothetical protein